ncbi:MAG: CCA tRNA nucleotidyltransferase, partial [Cyanobacteria bacterium J06576_12]
MPESWPFPAALLPAEAHLVGGSVRDQLLKRQSSYLDLDFILPTRAVETASDLAKACNAGFVVLDKERQIARVVFDEVTVDFAQQQGGSLEADLRRRDFTVNAIAYHPHTQSIVDPLGGQADLTNKTLRMVSAQNLEEDPLRLMRAYRQAAQLNFSLDEKTQQTIHQLAPRLKTISVERIRSELDALLSVTAGTAQLASILEHQLLQFCLPHFNAASIQEIVAIETAFLRLKEAMPSYAELLLQWPKSVPVGSHRSCLNPAAMAAD